MLYLFFEERYTFEPARHDHDFLLFGLLGFALAVLWNLFGLVYVLLQVVFGLCWVCFGIALGWLWLAVSQVAQQSKPKAECK